MRPVSKTILRLRRRSDAKNLPMLSLPEEIIDLIFQFLVPAPSEYNTTSLKSIDVRTLISVALTCKQFRRIVEPYLYRHVKGGPYGCSARLYAILDAKPWRADHVKSLIACETAFTDFSPGYRKDYQISPFETNSALIRRRDKATFPLITTKLPNLEVLDASRARRPWELADGQTPPWLRLVNMHWDAMGSRCLRPDFGALRRLDAFLGTCSIQELYSVFKLPSIEALNFTGGDMAGSGDLWAQTMANPYMAKWDFVRPNIKHLSFRGTEPAIAWPLKCIARTCPRLVSLVVIGPRRRGAGPYFYRALIFLFRKVVNNPDFRRLELWDPRTSSNHLIPSLPHPNVMPYVLSRFSPIEEIVIDQDTVRSARLSPTVQQPYQPAFPRGLRKLVLRSNAAPKLASQQAFLFLLRTMVRMVRDMPALQDVVVELQPIDHLAKAFLKKNAADLLEKGVLKIKKKEDCGWDIFRVAVGLRLLTFK